MEIFFDDTIRRVAPDLKVILIESAVSNCDTDDALWQRIGDACAELQRTTPMERLRHRPAIDATRAVYKALGKDPNRYRPSAEALGRRAIKGMELYRTTALIDLINLVSLLTGHSIGGFDADKIEGEVLTLGAGMKDEPYEAIGRGLLNIEGLPVFRDALGGIGTPTSDNERTKLESSTKRILMTVNMYGPSEMSDDEVETLIHDLLVRHAGASEYQSKVYKP